MGTVANQKASQKKSKRRPLDCLVKVQILWAYSHVRADFSTLCVQIPCSSIPGRTLVQFSKSFLLVISIIFPFRAARRSAGDLAVSSDRCTFLSSPYVL